MPYREDLHWTVGRYDQVFWTHYHYCVTYNPETKKAKVLKNPNISRFDNDNCKDGKYAEHTRLGNTGCTGIALCGMLGYKSPKDVGKYPITDEQFQAACKLMAELSIKDKFNITPATCYTHYEHDQRLPKPSGKIDIIYLPCHPEISADKMGDFIRGKVQWYRDKLLKKEIKFEYS